MRVLICGGRDFNDWDFFKGVVDLFNEKFGITTIIHGCARGADTFAERWAKENQIPVLRFMANWNRFGRAAGPTRNREMLENGHPDLVLAFPTGGPGTANMIEISKVAGIPVREFSK